MLTNFYNLVSTIVHLYKELLGQIIIIYMIIEIKKPGFKKLDFFISFIISSSKDNNFFIDNMKMASMMVINL